jgi:hypothetical protein
MGWLPVRYNRSTPRRTTGWNSLDTIVYKLYNQDLLDTLDRGRMGYRIGTSHVGSPACADDVALLARSVKELQQQTRAAERQASMDRYNINASKSDILVFNSKTTPDDWNSILDVSLFNHHVRAAEAAVHLGVDRRTSSKVRILKNIQKGRATTYSLMGAGMHGINCIKPTVSLQMWIFSPSPGFCSALKPLPSQLQISRNWSPIKQNLLSSYKVLQIEQRTLPPLL